MAMVDYTTASPAPRGLGHDPYGDEDEDENGFWSLSKCKRSYMDYVGNKREEIDEQKVSRSYRHGAQWTVTQTEVFNKRKQPVVTYNRIGRKVDSIIGLMEKLKQDPKAYPRNPRMTDEMGAQLATSAVRYVVESDLRESRFPFAIENGAVDGIGGVEMMLIKGDKGDKDIGFALVRTDSYFYDPCSFDNDFEDARYQGQAKWLTLADARALAPDKETAAKIEHSPQSGTELTSNPDRERRWFDMESGSKMVRVVDIWYKSQGEWRWCLFTGSMKIDEGKGYFYNEKNEMICKYIMFSSFVDHDGDRYGFIRSLKSSQDEINQRRSKGLHELNSRRIKAEDGAFADIEVTRREAVRPDGVVIYNKGFEMEFDDQARIANVEGQLKFLEDAKNEIENFGPNPALIGQGLEYKSGRAINLLQQAGIAELGPFVIGIKNWKLRLYRAIWCAVQRYWTAERYIRVTDDEGLAQLIQVNGIGIDPATGLPRLINAIGTLDVNFVLDEGPDEVNMMGDAYDTLVALTAQGANIPPQVLLELAPLQGQLKRKLLALLEKKDPIEEAAKGLTIEDAKAKVEETHSKTALNMAKAQEAQQGGAHSIVERQIDIGAKREQHQMKMAESSIKVQTEQEKARIKAGVEFAKLQSTQAKSQQDIETNALKGEMQLRQGEEKHQAAMRQKAANGGSRPEARKYGGHVYSEDEEGKPKSYLVGEDGPEIIIPREDGYVIPNPKTRFAQMRSGRDPIDDAAAQYNVDPNYMRTLRRIESGGDPYNKTGRYKGWFQQSDEQFKQYGGTGSIYDPEQQALTAARRIAKETADFEARYGRKPEKHELYLGWQQGWGGFAAHNRNPSAPAWQNMLSTGEGQKRGPEWAKAAIWGNIPDQYKKRFGSVDNVSSQALMDIWRSKVAGGPGPAIDPSKFQPQDWSQMRPPPISLATLEAAGGSGAPMQLFGGFQMPSAGITGEVTGSQRYRDDGSRGRFGLDSLRVEKKFPLYGD